MIMNTITIKALEDMVKAKIYETIEEAIDEYALSCERRLK